jgi:uncharacterized FlaG/YvyC family protein
MLSTWLNPTSTSSDLYSTLSTSSSGSSANANAVQDTTEKAQTKTDDDTVKLSTAAQERMLYKQGESVSTIASAMGSSVKAVDQDLNITLDKEIAQTLQATQAAATTK